MSRLRFLDSIFIGSTVALFSLFSVSFVFAIDEPEVKVRDDAYSAKYVSQSIPDPITIEAGKSVEVSFRFKNTGSAVWDSQSARYISAYTMQPRYRDSFFAGKDWISKSQTPKVSGSVGPGEIGTLTFTLTAPGTPGEYEEHFYLAAENYSWVEDGWFFVKVNVVAAPTPSVSQTEEVKQPEMGGVHEAKRIGFSKKKVSVVGGERIKVVSIFQNTGDEAWPSYYLKHVDSGDGVLFADESWKDARIAFEKTSSVAPSESARETFYFRAPKNVGVYSLEFTWGVDGTDTSAGALVEVEVTQDAPSGYVSPYGETYPEGASCGYLSPYGDDEVRTVVLLDKEPRIRVGLWKPEKTAQFVSYEDTYVVYNGQKAMGFLPKKKVAILTHVGGVYSYKGAGLSFKTNDYIRLEPQNDPHAIFTLLNYDRHVSWKGPGNFNTYRGAFELRTTQEKKTLYGINDLLFEDYVAGIGENANHSPEEYLKSQSIAQRTYAYAIQQDGQKHKGRNFDVVATTGDQLYLGAASEKIMPRFVAAARATRGKMVTYEGDVALTPYYGNSSGRTLAWTEVWGGAHKPWLVSVTAHYDQGRRRLGHGVGMSQRDAAIRADQEGVSAEALIKYYYRGTEVTKMYH